MQPDGLRVGARLWPATGVGVAAIPVCGIAISAGACRDQECPSHRTGRTLQGVGVAASRSRYNAPVATRWTTAIVTRALVRGLAEFLHSFWRAARQLFHEATGAFFIVFAGIGALSAWRQWQRGSAEWLVAVSVAFTLMMGGLAAASFRSARRLR